MHMYVIRLILGTGYILAIYIGSMHSQLLNKIGPGKLIYQRCNTQECSQNRTDGRQRRPRTSIITYNSADICRQMYRVAELKDCPVSTILNT